MANRKNRREQAHERPAEIPAAAEGAPRRGVDVTQIKPGEPTSPDEAGDVSIANADNPMLVREENKNSSDSSGVRADSEAAGEQIKELLRRGGQEVSRMD
jgi:hypothetical protein